MKNKSKRERRSHRVNEDRSPVQALANQAFSRAAGASLIEGNEVRLLKDAAENYPAWLDAIRGAQQYVHFESYIIHEDEAGWLFAEALSAKAREGVRVRIIYDWMGGLGKSSRSFWAYLRAEGVEVRCYNPISLASPFGWVHRDHRKILTVDGEIGFVTGLCVGQMWVGDPEKNIEPWRDTGVEVRGPAVSDIEQAFAQVWDAIGEKLPADDIAKREDLPAAGDTAIRVVASQPATAGMMRLDQLVAALATKRLWLTDAYYAGTSPYVQALRAAARDGVDVRLLVPNATDIPLLRPLSRAGYRPLLEGGVRVFEWNGTMLHAKTAVADSKWARVGSTNLNVASWFGNLELDVVVEDASFAELMEHMYLDDLENATEVVLDARHKLRAPNEPRHHRRRSLKHGGGSAGRAAAGALRISNAVGAAFTNRRVLEPVEARLMLMAGTLLLALAVLFWFYPRALTYPLGIIMVWFAFSLLYRGYKLHFAQDWHGRDRLPEPGPAEKNDNTRQPPLTEQ
ncbi:MAG TPA: phospholipase D-like domain-containing protein [Pyrinomonadaceae bacterium]|nr:phospholipase D-like domain-containing protein [Pyrinomonadaceae bacterium]